jgi:hypothetical protein
MARPVSHGMTTVMPIASAASAALAVRPPRQGLRKPSSRLKVAILAPV